MFNNMGVELNVSLLVGSMTAAAKRKVYEDIENGSTRYSNWNTCCNTGKSDI